MNLFGRVIAFSESVLVRVDMILESAFSDLKQFMFDHLACYVRASDSP